MNFKVLWLFTKVFTAKFGGMASFGNTSKQSAEILFSTNLQKFSPAKVSRYMVWYRNICEGGQGFHSS